MSISITRWKTSASCSGQLFAKALGDRKGINRAGYFVLPMDETLAVVALDLGGRPALVYKDKVKVRLVGDLQTELVEDFFGGFVNHAGANLHAKVLYGRSSHHKIEAIFKCFARALRYACSKDARLKDQLPSTKGLVSDQRSSITAPAICGRCRIRWVRSARITNLFATRRRPPRARRRSSCPASDISGR